MEGGNNFCLTLLSLHDRVEQKIQETRYSKHIEMLHELKSLKKSNSDYAMNRSDIAFKLDRNRRASREVNGFIEPIDVQYRNCQRRLKEIHSGSLKLPKIGTAKLKQNLKSKENSNVNVMRKQEKQRIQLQNNILNNKINHLSLQKKQKQRQLYKQIEEYQKYKNISRKIKDNRTQQKHLSLSQQKENKQL